MICVVYSQDQGVMSVSVDLGGENLSLFIWSHSSVPFDFQIVISLPMQNVH